MLLLSEYRDNSNRTWPGREAGQGLWAVAAEACRGRLSKTVGTERFNRAIWNYVPAVQASIAGSGSQIASPTQMAHPDEGIPPESKGRRVGESARRVSGIGASSPIVLKAGLYFLEVDLGSQLR